MLKLAINSWVSKMAATILNFGTAVVLSRNLGAGERGTCAFYTVVIALALVFNELAAGSTSVYLQQHMHWRQIRKLAIVWSFVASFFIASFFWMVGKYGARELMFLWSAGFLNGVVTIQYNILLGKRKYLIYNSLSILTPLIILVLMIFLALLKQSLPITYLLSINSALLVALLIGWLILKNEKGNNSGLGWLPWKVVIRRSFGAGFVNQAGHVVSIFNNRFPFYILPAATLGVFTNALSLAEAMLLVPSSIGQVYYSQVAGQSKNPAATHASNFTFNRLGIMNVVLMALITIAVQFIPPSLFAWVFGPQFGGVSQFLRILSVGSLVYSVYLLISYWQSARGGFRSNLYASSVGLIINILGIICLLAFEKMNLPNVVWLMVVSNAFVALAAFGLFWREQKRPAGSMATV